MVARYKLVGIKIATAMAVAGVGVGVGVGCYILVAFRAVAVDVENRRLISG